MKVEFNTTEFQFSHGRMPRGRGGWVFEVDAGPAAPASVVAAFEQAARDVGMCRVEEAEGRVQVWAQSMTYGDAKRVMRDVFKAACPRVQYASVKVCP